MRTDTPSITSPWIVFENRTFIRRFRVPRKAVFLDRDGTLNHHISSDDTEFDSPYAEAELEIVAGAPQALRRMIVAGYLPIVISNQPGVAKRKCTIRRLWQITHVLLSGLRAGGADVGAVLYCLHHPGAVLRAFRTECQCRKPRPGSFLSAAKRYSIDLRASLAVGDRVTDREAAQAVGCDFIRIDSSECWRRRGDDPSCAPCSWPDVARIVAAGTAACGTRRP